METLGFGTHVVIDGFQAKAERLGDEVAIRALLERIAQLLEPETEVTVQLARFGDGDDGISAGTVLTESQLSVHTFATRRCLTFTAFSHRDMPLAWLLSELRQLFKMGRYESYLGNRSKVYAHHSEKLLITLKGERSYAHARLDETLLAY